MQRYHVSGALKQLYFIFSDLRNMSICPLRMLEGNVSRDYKWLESIAVSPWWHKETSRPDSHIQRFLWKWQRLSIRSCFGRRYCVLSSHESSQALRWRNDCCKLFFASNIVKCTNTPICVFDCHQPVRADAIVVPKDDGCFSKESICRHSIPD